MRELAVQSASDTNTGTDRSFIQDEINALNNELNRISSSTEFNSVKFWMEHTIISNSNWYWSKPSFNIGVTATDSSTLGAYEVESKLKLLQLQKCHCCSAKTASACYCIC